MIYTNKANDELIVNCDCGCGSGLLWQAVKWDDEEQFYIMLTEHSWYAKQSGRIKPYFKRLWKALRGKEYCLTEIVMKRTEVEEYMDFLGRWIKKNEGEHDD